MNGHLDLLQLQLCLIPMTSEVNKLKHLEHDLCKCALSCNLLLQDRDGRISLVEFRRMVEQKPAGNVPPAQEEQEGVEPEKEKEGGGRQ